MNPKRILLILSFLLLTFSFLQAEDEGSCPPFDPNCPWEVYQFEIPLTAEGGAKAIVKIRKRICNGEVQIVYDTIFAVRNSNVLDKDTTFYEKNFSALRELIDLNLIEKADYYLNIRIPFCPEVTHIYKFYGATCGVWVKCSYEVLPQTQKCDIGYAPPMPVYGNNGKPYVDVYKWQPCGDVCCRKDYMVCQEYFPDRAEAVVHIINVTKKAVTECSREGQFVDWKTGQIIHCKPGC